MKHRQSVAIANEIHSELWQLLPCCELPGGLLETRLGVVGRSLGRGGPGAPTLSETMSGFGGEGSTAQTPSETGTNPDFSVRDADSVASGSSAPGFVMRPGMGGDDVGQRLSSLSLRDVEKTDLSSPQSQNGDDDDGMITVRAHNKKARPPPARAPRARTPAASQTGEITVMRVRKGTPMKEVMSKYAQNKGARRRRGTGRRGARVSRARRARSWGPSLVRRRARRAPGRRSCHRSRRTA